MTHKGSENLQRGSQKGDVARTANARKALAEERAHEKDLRSLARTDPEAALLELHGDLTVGLHRVVKKWLNTGTKEPSRQLVEGARELRQLSDRVIDILNARGAATEAEQFFAELSSRLSSPDLAEEPRPVVSVPGS